MIPFKPVIEPDLEGAFLTEHPVDIIKTGRAANVPWILGVNTDDGALRVAGKTNPQEAPYSLTVRAFQLCTEFQV